MEDNTKDEKIYDKDYTSKCCDYCLNGNVNALKSLLEEGISVKDIHAGFLLACYYGHVKIVQVLLEAKKYLPSEKYEPKKLGTPYICNIRINILRHHYFPFDQVCTPLLAACWGGHLTTVKLLLGSGADCEVCDDEGSTPLMAASEMGHCDIVKELKAHLGDTNYFNKQNNKGFTALFYAASNGHIYVIQELIVMQSVSIGNSLALLLASCLGEHSAIVQLLQTTEPVSTKECQDRIAQLIDEKCVGAKFISCIEDANAEGNTQLLLACQNGLSITTTALLKCQADIRVQNSKGNSAMIIACQGNHSKVVKELILFEPCSIRWCNTKGLTPLMAAARNGNTIIAQILLSKLQNTKVYIDCMDNSGKTALMYACQNGHYKMVDMLITKGVDVNKWDENEYTPLILSCVHGHKEIVECLLKNGAKVDFSNIYGITPLMAACSKSWFDIANLLIQAGASTSIEDYSGKSVISKARSDPILHLLQNKTATPVVVKYGADKPKKITYLSDMPSGYTVRYESDFCCVLLPQENHYTVQVNIIKENFFDSIFCMDYLVELKLEGRIYDHTRPCIMIFPMSETGILRDQKSKFFAIWKKEEKETDWSHSINGVISNETSVSCLAYHSGYFFLIDDNLVKNYEKDSDKQVEKCERASEDQLDHIPYLSDIPKGYIIHIGTEFCGILLPQENQTKVQVEKLSESMYPSLEENESLCTSAVVVKPEGLKFDSAHPCVLVFPFADKSLEINDGTLILLHGKFGESYAINWEPIDSKLSNIIVDKDSILVSAISSGIYTVKSIVEPEIIPSIYQSQIPDDYTIRCETDFCCLLLHQESNLSVQIEEISDNIYPSLNETESLITRPVVLKPGNVSFDRTHPCIMVFSTDKPLKKEEKMAKITTICRDKKVGSSMAWRPVDPSLSHCSVDDKFVSICVQHSGIYAVKSSTEYPSTLTQVKPNEKSIVSVPELNNFQLEIADSAICPNEENIAVKSTVHFCDKSYNASEVCAAASSCIKFEPHGQTFTRPIQVVVPIPDYDEIIAEYPDIKLNVWCSESYAKKHLHEVPQNWQILNGSDVTIEDGIGPDGHSCKIAKFEIEHFSFYQCVFDKVKKAFKNRKFGAEYLYSQVFRKRKSLIVKMKAVMSEPKDGIFAMIVYLYRFGDPLTPSEKKHYPYSFAGSDKKIELSEGKFKLILKGNRFLNENLLVEEEREGVLKLFEGESICHKSEYVLELKSPCSLPLRRSQVLGSVKLKQKEVSERYTLMMDEDSPSVLDITTALKRNQLGQIRNVESSESHDDRISKLLQQFNITLGVLQSSPTEMQLRRISLKQGLEWEACATALQLSVHDIDDIKTNNERNVQEQRFRALIQWKRKEGHTATHEVLIKQFISVQRTDLAEYVCELVSTSK